MALVSSAWLLVPHALAEGQWIPLHDPAPVHIGNMLLLSDGTVMAQPYAVTNTWYRLTPGRTGGYTNGTWTMRQPMHYSRLYCASAVLPDGRVFVAGGEYGNGTTNAEVYTPECDSWAIIPIPPGLIYGFSDAPCVVLDSGQVLVAPVSPGTQLGTLLFDPASNTLSAGPTLTNQYVTEDSFVKLPDGSVLVIDSSSVTSERYLPSQNKWRNDAILPVPLYDLVGGELGPGLLLPNGHVFFLGSVSATGIYVPSGNDSPGSWLQGPNVPGLGAPDAPAAMLVNGKVLCALSPPPTDADHFPSPTYFYEYDFRSGTVGSFSQIHAPDGSYTENEPTQMNFMLALPDGTVLLSEAGNQLFVYVPDGSPMPAAKPTITSINPNPDGSYHLTGTQLNGISAGAAYGDDAQMDSNYPLVRLTGSGGNVFYARTYNWSSTAVMTGTKPVSTEFVVPAAAYQNGGPFSLVVIANGISSEPVSFSLSGPNTWVVRNNQDSGLCSLRDALANAASGDRITFAPNVVGTITLTSGELLIGQGVNVLGPGANILTVNGNNATRVFHVTNGASVLANLGIANGHTLDGGGGIALEGDVSLTLDSCTISNCYAAGAAGVLGGGGIYAGHAHHQKQHHRQQYQSLLWGGPDAQSRQFLHDQLYRLRQPHDGQFGRRLWRRRHLRQ
jgi:hypothetical protein